MFSPKLRQYIESLQHTYFGWFIQNYKVSILIIVLLIVYGSYVVVTIPKESTPTIKFGIVNISTIYPGANPLDIDSTITQKIEDKIKDMPGIDTINSTSSLWLSNISLTLKNDIDTKDFINDLKTDIDTLIFPSDVKDPIIKELSTDNQVLFQMILYAPRSEFTMNHMRSLAMRLRDDIEGKAGIVDVTVDGVSDDSDFDITIGLDQQAMTNYGLSLASVVSQIRSYKQNTPLGNHALGDFRYDYRIANELISLKDLSMIPLSVGGTSIMLADIATIHRDYKRDDVTYGGVAWSADNNAIGLTIFKADKTSIFQVSEDARALIAQTMKKVDYQRVSFAYSTDISDVIIDDYKSLGNTAWQSVLLILIISALFIGIRQALIASFSMVLSFFITFIVLDQLDYSLNFLTNFSLILAFGAGIDTIIVFIEAAWENMKKWFNPKTAMLLAVNTYREANINTSLINIVVFIPLLVLPGVTGKFLSYIPLTIFSTLLASLILALTTNGALFTRLNKALPYYYAESHDEDEEETAMHSEEKKILALEQQGKTVRALWDKPRLDGYIDHVRSYYLHLLARWLSSRKNRLIVIFTPIVLLILSFIFLAPSIGFKLFPSGDNPVVNISFTAKEGTTTASLVRQLSGVDTIIASIPEVKSYKIAHDTNKATATVVLVKEEQREKDSFAIEQVLLSGLQYYTTQWLKVESKVQAWWPPTGKAVGLKLIASETSQLSELKRVSKEFEAYLHTLSGTINVTNTSTNAPGQFEFTFDSDLLTQLGLTPQDIQWELYTMINGSKAGTMMIDQIERDIIVKVADLDATLTPEKILNTVIQTRSGPLTIGSVATVTINQSLTSIGRVDADIVITVEADLEAGMTPTAVQPLFEAFAKDYDYPSGISYKAGGENEANADLISATLGWFFVALFLAFVILVYQFNSFTLPAIILYSVFTALLGSIVGLWITNNPFSMGFGIGFISLLWVILNTAVFLVDRIKYNIQLGSSTLKSIMEAGKTRFRPIVISSLATVLGLLPSVMQDPFYAWLGWTVIFGLIFSGVITLLALPCLYYMLFAKSVMTDLHD